MRIPRLTMRLTIQAKLLVLSGALIAALIGSNVYMRTHISAGTAALSEQTRLQDDGRLATSALRAFGELKFWLTDLEVSWLNESEDNANQARAVLDEQMQALTAIAPDEVETIRGHVDEFGELSIQAVDAYVDENRVLGNSLAAKVRTSIATVDAILVAIDDDIRQQAAAAETASTAASTRALDISLVVFLGASLMALILTWLTLRSVVGPMRKIVFAMTQVSQGNIEVAVPTVTKDEIGDLAQALSVFKENAIEKQRLEEQQLEDKKRAEEEKREAMTMLANNFESNVMGIVDAVSSASSEMRSSAESMTSTAEETSRRSTAVSVASEQAAGNVQTVAAAAEELSSSITEIGRQVTQSADIAQTAVTDADRANTEVEGLAEAAQKIGDVVSLINDIASQTNLLALNATIEPARAGDAGKGFAVVASEVKSLATQTAKATEVIASQISGMQSATSDAVEAIKGIGGRINELAEIAIAISAAVEQQGAATQEISGNVLQAAQGTSEVNQNISGVNQAAADTGESAGQVLAATNELSSQAEQLRTQVDAFINEVRAA